MPDGAVAGFYDFTAKHPNEEMRGGHGTRIRVGEIFEINSMDEFSDSSKTMPHGRRGWMQLVDAPVTVKAPVPTSIPGQVPGQENNVSKPIAVREAETVQAAQVAGQGSGQGTGSQKVI